MLDSLAKGFKVFMKHAGLSADPANKREDSLPVGLVVRAYLLSYLDLNTDCEWPPSEPGQHVLCQLFSPGQSGLLAVGVQEESN